MANKESTREGAERIKTVQSTERRTAAPKSAAAAPQSAVHKPMPKKKPSSGAATVPTPPASGRHTPSAAQRSIKQAKRSAQKTVQKNTGNAVSNAVQRVSVTRIVFGILVTLAALAVGFFIWARAQNTLSVPENAIGSLISPIQAAVSSVTDWVSELVTGGKERSALEAENETLRLENMTMSYRISQLEEQEQENERLRGILETQQRYDELDPVYARVIAKESGRWFDVFAINRGTMHGVKTGMAVINQDGLIGRVYEAGVDYAKVMALIDPRSSTACLIQRTRDNGVMKGQIAGSSTDASCNMYYVPSVSDIVPGDVVITSGLDGLYPKGLIVGSVREVSRQSDTSDQYVVITPAVDFERIEDVLVLQTVVVSADELLAPLPSPTTRAKPTTAVATATPDPSVTATPVSGPNNWAYPMVTPDPNATSAPIRGGVRPEEQWAQGN